MKLASSRAKLEGNPEHSVEKINGLVEAIIFSGVYTTEDLVILEIGNRSWVGG